MGDLFGSRAGGRSLSVAVGVIVVAPASVTLVAAPASITLVVAPASVAPASVAIVAAAIAVAAGHCFHLASTPACVAAVPEAPDA
jgi:hypothetical protein